MAQKKKLVLVTGGAGYIGSHTIVELIESGYEVISIDNFSNSSPKVFKQIYKLTGIKVKNYEVDLCDQTRLNKLFKGKKFNAIIHFAAFKAVGESVANPLLYYQNNIGALLGILNIAKNCTAECFIYSSSAAVYDQKAEVPYIEKSSLAPISPYGMTKKIGEEILSDFTHNNSMFKVLCLRYFNPVGAHPSLLIGENPKGEPNNLVPIIVNAVKKNKPFTVFGNTYNTKDKTCIRDYIHVVDVARAHVSALKYLESKKSIKYDILNIGTGRGTSVLDLIKAFEKVNNLKSSYVFGVKRPGDIAVVYADTKKASHLLKFKPQYTISDMLKTAWEYRNTI